MTFGRKRTLREQMLYRVTHQTVYAYERRVLVSHNEARVTPRKTPSQAPLRTHLLIEPTPGEMVVDQDFFGNTLHFFSLEEPHDRLSVAAVSDVEVNRVEPPALALTPAWESVANLLRRDHTAYGLEALGYTYGSPFVPIVPDVLPYAMESFAKGRPVLDAALELTERIHRDFRYEQGTTSIATPIREVLRTRQGVCQDFAHVEIGMLRALGLSARYVSGYVRTHPPPGKPRLVGADASHAWVSLYCPGFGYVDLDPTNGVIPTDEHVTVAWGRDFGDVSPLRGVILGGGRHTLSVSVDVEL
ncbi:MAG TPA: transglutaminase family protein [Polyangiaceae bacterium]|jgi:transglutaminase-like putative cysteine protease|nr:transglutaminase family protein [Polyangiaceae bacterium]